MNARKLNRTLFIRDNLDILRTIKDKSVDLIYLDPPFNSNKNYGQPIGSKLAGFHFKDMWYLSDTDEAWWGELSESSPSLYNLLHSVGTINGKKDKSYLIYMTMRLIEMHRILKDTGSIYLHCDQTMSHSLKLVMDAIFGKKNFKREIIWNIAVLSGFKTIAKNWIRGHDVILYYSKSKNAYFEKQYTPHTEKYLSMFNKEDSEGKYLIAHNKKRYKKDVIRKGRNIGDVWSDIKSFQQICTSKEKVGYKTQKPLALVDRIIKASSKEGDLVLDPFCGCATTCISAEKLKRKWIGIDISDKASDLIKMRFKDELGLKPSLVTIRRDLPIKNAP